MKNLKRKSVLICVAANDPKEEVFPILVGYILEGYNDITVSYANGKSIYYQTLN